MKQFLLATGEFLACAACAAIWLAGTILIFAAW